MKKIFSFFLVILMILVQSFNSFSQEKKASTKKSQSTLPNEIWASYGIGSVYIFTNGIKHNYDYTYSYLSQDPKNIQSFGTVSFGYNRMLNRILMIGFQGSYLNCNYTRAATYYYNYDSTRAYSASYDENILNGIAKLTLNYYNKKSLRIYSSFAFGISVIFGNVTSPGFASETERKILPGGQLTMLGMRFGRTVGGFAEFGFGSNAIISAGISVQLKDSEEGE